MTKKPDYKTLKKQLSGSIAKVNNQLLQGDSLDDIHLEDFDELNDVLMDYIEFRIHIDEGGGLSVN
tara:strand:- start:171 stop:368 length:198 start_codon:yes stop_codon:yes gene_type:complete